MATRHGAKRRSTALCSFERMELVKAEELFRKSLKTERNDCAETMLAKIANIRKGEPWAKRAEARRKFWKHWADTELTQLSGEQRQKQMAEVVAGRRQPFILWFSVVYRASAVPAGSVK